MSELDKNGVQWNIEMLKLSLLRKRRDLTDVTGGGYWRSAKCRHVGGIRLTSYPINLLKDLPSLGYGANAIRTRPAFRHRAGRNISMSVFRPGSKAGVVSQLGINLRNQGVRSLHV